ncbi:NUDIX domain-containing protein [Candidatus Woesearchaeota archaeon]|nr:NUDIX domain-containing protein [Candidatus Woesearchaeota archaeon]
MREISAGAIVFREEKGKIFYLLLHYEEGHWDFPKGNIDEGEEEKETVKREIKEETGITKINFIESFMEKISYFYKMKGETVYKEVFFYLAETEESNVKLSFEHIGYKWLNYDEAFKELTYKNAKEILKKANSFLN